MLTEHADAMVEVIQRTFDMMFQIKAVPSERRRETVQLPPFAVSGVIGIAGQTTGCIVLSFPDEVARKLTALTFAQPGEEFGEEDIYDCVGEIANIVGGNMLPLLGEQESEHRVSLPSVVVGAHRIVWRRKDTPYDLVLFDTELGRFGAGINFHKEETIASGEGGGRTFLLIDDSRLMRRLLKNALTEAVGEGCHFIEASDGQAGLDALQQMEYNVDLIFCDLYMPNLDGLGFLDSLAADGRLESCPVVVVTGDTSDGMAEQAVARGARQWIGKPFTAETVGHILREALGTA